MSRDLRLFAALAAVASIGIGPSFVSDGFREEPRPVRRRREFDVIHIDTPKPISKRKARRMRGKGQPATIGQQDGGK